MNPSDVARSTPPTTIDSGRDAHLPSEPREAGHSAGSQPLPKVSFLVPAWNAEGHVAAFVRAFMSLSSVDAELVLCTGGSDGGHDVARRFEGERVHVVEQHASDGKQGALRKCFPISSGEIIYLTDIDCRPSDEVVMNLVRPLAMRRSEVVTGASMPLPSQMTSLLTRVHWAIERATLADSECEAGGILGRNAALRRSVIEQIRPFDVPAPSGTDYVLAKEVLRHGYRILFVPGSPMPSEYPSRFWIYVHKQARWLRNVSVLGTRYGARTEVLAVLPTLLMPFLLAAGIVATVWLKHVVVLSACLLVVARALANRQEYQRRAGFRPSLAGSATVLLADQLAAVKATWQMVRRKSTW